MAAAMAGAALFLNWAKPQPHRTRQHYLEREWLTAARSVVGDSATPDLTQWDAVEAITAAPAAGGGGPLVSPSSDGQDWRTSPQWHPETLTF